jgi:F-type H+-transporting ATPase subunit c
MKKIVAGTSALLVTLFSAAALAQEAGAASNTFDAQAAAALGAGVAIGLGGLGAALGQGRVAASALEGISRNPGADGKIRGNMILGLALIESIALYAFVIAFLLQGKVGH